MSQSAPPFADESYVAFTTFKKNGDPRPTPVWIADIGDGQLGFTTSSSSYKVKRLANNPRVELQPSDARGNPKPGSEKLTGTAEVLSGADFEAIRRIMKKKYGMQYRGIALVGQVAKLLGRGTGTNAAIRITLDDGA
jgi:PPOX class probable F420-dependent enzyme